jgi:hypothetical protein
MYKMRTLGYAQSEYASDLTDLLSMSQGEVGGLAAFYDRWSGLVRATVVKCVPDRGDAEIDDVLEDVFWQAWRGVAQRVGGIAPMQPIDRWLDRLIYKSVARFYAGELAA